MSDLTAFRDHCRRMAAELDKSRSHLRLLDAADARSKRDLWTMLADEVDAYLANGPADEPLDLA